MAGGLTLGKGRHPTDDEQDRVYGNKGIEKRCFLP